MALTVLAGVAAAAEYLAVCEKCLNPRVTAKQGFATAAASATAVVGPEDAAAWCAVNRPRDPICAREEVRNGGDGGRKSYAASANCPAGVLQSLDGYEYRYAGLWPDGPGRGRPMLKDTGGNRPGWNSIAFGRGIARSEWDMYGGYSLTVQWEVLCGSVHPAAGARPPAAAPRQRASGQRPPADAGGEWLASCFRCPAPVVISKSGIGTGNAVAEARMTADVLRESCAETDPRDVAGCVRREMADAGRKTYRASADCTAGRITTIDDGQYTLAGVWDNSDIGAGRTKWRGADGQIVGRDNASNGLAISQQWELLCPGPLPPALIAQSARPAGRPTNPAAAPAPSVCAGKRYCEETPAFAAIIRDFRTSSLSDSTRIATATVKVLNKTSRPLILGYVRGAGVAIDDQGNRYVLPGPEAVRGIGEIGGREFDPKFTLAPGQTADTRFEFAWRWDRRSIIGQRAWDVDLTLREVNEVAPGQYRFGQEHALQFKSVPAAGGANASAAQPAETAALAPASPSSMPSAPVSAAPLPDPCAGRKACFNGGSFVAEIRQATLAREGNQQDRVARLNVDIRNTGGQPISLAYVAKSSVLIDNLGNRFFWGTAGTYDNSATGIGKVEANRADPQFTLAPGQSRMATFTLRRRTARGDADGTGYSYSVTLAQLEIINGQQVRTTREHSVSFQDFGMTMPGAFAAAPGQQAPQSIRELGDALRRLGKRK